MGSPGPWRNLRGGIRPQLLATCEIFWEASAFRIRCGAKPLTRRGNPPLECGVDPVVTGRPNPAANADAAGGRTYSITELAEMTGWHRDTISDWTRRKENPLPTVSGGSHEVEYRISLRRLIDWREDQARVEGAKGPAVGAVGFMGIVDPYNAIIARDKFVKMGESERALVHRAPMQAATHRAFGLVRQAVPDRLARDMAGFPADRVSQWRRGARSYCQEALADAASAIRDMAEAVAGDVGAAG